LAEERRVAVIISTFPSIEEAEKVGGKLVEEGLAACVSLLECRSIYKWEGKLEDSPEILILAKTADDLLEEAREFIAENHPYEVPEILSIHIDDVDEGYRKWLLASVRAKP